jgi:DNA repair exonuclease SbcCD ATPase subunit
MNNPTREDFDRLEANLSQLASNYRRLEAEVQQLREQPHVIVDHRLTGYEPFKEVLNKQDEHMTKLEEIGADITNLRATQSDWKEWRKEDLQYRKMYGDRLDDHFAVIGGVLNHIESDIATKEDIAQLAAKQDTLASKEDLTAFATKEDLTAVVEQFRTELQQALTQQTHQFEHAIEQLRTEQQQTFAEILRRLPPV